MDDKTRKLYTGKRSSCAYAGAEKVDRAKKLNLNQKQIVEKLSGFKAYATHRPLRRKFPRRFVYVPTVNHQIGADLIEIKHPRSNFHKRYILAILDHFSRKAWLEPLKNKSADEVLRAFKKIFARGNVRAKLFYSDRGLEFISKKMKDFFKSKGIESFVSYSPTKCSLNERFNRSLMGRVSRYQTHAKTKRFIHLLPEFERHYNNSYHQTIRMTPNQVTEENVPLVWQNIYQRKIAALKKIKTQALKEGDYVLLPIKKGTFDKGYSQTFGEEVFRIKDVKNTRPVTYGVVNKQGEEVLGSFYNQELVKIPHELE